MNGDDQDTQREGVPLGALSAALGGGGPSAVNLTGASRSFRNNNPGNLKAFPIAYANGAIGKDKDGFAIFPDYASGRRAQAALWGTQKYGNTPIGQAVGNWGGLYAQQLGINPNQTFAQLTPEQQQAVMTHQQTLEGWKPGAATSSPNYGPPGTAQPTQLAMGTPPPQPGVPPAYSVQPPQPSFPPPGGTGAMRQRMRADLDPTDDWSS